MNCKDAAELMPAFVDDELTVEQAAEFRVHTVECAKCRDMAKVVAAFTANLDAQIKGYGRKIKPPPGAQDELLLKLGSMAGEPTHTRRLWIAVAAMFLGAFCMYAWYSIGGSRQGDWREEELQRAQLNEKLNVLECQSDFYDKLEKLVRERAGDRRLALTACAYLPPERADHLLRGALTIEPNSGDVLKAWMMDPVCVVKMTRTTQREGRKSDLVFEQWSDGRVHVEHVEKTADGEVRTTLDDPDWETLASRNTPLCRELEIVDDQGNLIAGLPIPSALRMIREVQEAMHGGSPSGDLARRLLALRLAPTVANADELAQRSIVIGLDPAFEKELKIRPHDLPLAEMKRRIEVLEKEIGPRRLTMSQVIELSNTFDRLCEL